VPKLPAPRTAILHLLICPLLGGSPAYQNRYDKANKGGTARGMKIYYCDKGSLESTLVVTKRCGSFSSDYVSPSPLIPLNRERTLTPSPSKWFET
jgi:hypothetical protein